MWNFTIPVLSGQPVLTCHLAIPPAVGGRLIQVWLYVDFLWLWGQD